MNEDKGNISDGYHTFDELYEHRNLLFINLCLEQPGCCYWNRNGDYTGYFCLYRDTPDGQISYHITDKHLPLIDCAIEYAEVLWDGHTSNDVIERLGKLARILNEADNSSNRK